MGFSGRSSTRWSCWSVIPSFSRSFSRSDPSFAGRRQLRAFCLLRHASLALFPGHGRPILQLGCGTQSPDPEDPVPFGDSPDHGSALEPRDSPRRIRDFAYVLIAYGDPRVGMPLDSCVPGSPGPAGDRPWLAGCLIAGLSPRYLSGPLRPDDLLVLVHPDFLPDRERPGALPSRHPLNPLTHVVEGYRRLLLENQPAGSLVVPGCCSVFSLAVFALGGLSSGTPRGNSWMSSEPVILLKNLSKKYPIYDRPSSQAPGAADPPAEAVHREFWALARSRLEVPPGSHAGDHRSERVRQEHASPDRRRDTAADAGRLPRQRDASPHCSSSAPASTRNSPAGKTSS